MAAVFALMLMLPGVSRLGAALANPAVEAADEHLSALIERSKVSTVAVGTYKFTEKPPAKFLGTGFVILDGTRIVTNHHVIAPIKEKDRLFYLHIFHSDLPLKGLKAELIAEDKFHDLAILKIERSLTPLPLARPGTVKEGHSVVFTGYPIGFVLGLHPTSHTGIISAIAPLILPTLHGSMLKKEMIEHLKKPYDILQIDATAFPGNSGSPVYRKATGEVVGVINMVFVKGKKENALKDPTGLTYAIPVEHVLELAGQP